MTSRLALMPAGLADSAEDARRCAQTIATTSSAEPSAAIAQVLGALDAGTAGYFTVAHTDSIGALLCVPLPEDGVLESLLILAKDHDLAVYDMDLNRLYDPAGSAEVDVLMPHVRLPFLTRELLEDLVCRPFWPEPEAPYVIVERADNDFIQAWRDDDGTYQFEYREFGPESHFRCFTADPELVVEVMWAWVTGDQRWRTAVDWWFCDVDAELPSANADCAKETVVRITHR